MANDSEAGVNVGRTWLAMAVAGLLAAALLGLMGFWPTHAQAGSAGVVAMVAGLVASLLAAWLAALPAVLALRAAPRERINFLLGGLALRFAATIGLGVAAWLTGQFPVKPLLLWVALGHIGVMVADLSVLVTALNRTTKDS